jgi:hypothetical protein
MLDKQMTIAQIVHDNEVSSSAFRLRYYIKNSCDKKSFGYTDEEIHGKVRGLIYYSRSNANPITDYENLECHG